MGSTDPLLARRRNAAPDSLHDERLPLCAARLQDRDWEAGFGCNSICQAVAKKPFLHRQDTVGRREEPSCVSRRGSWRLRTTCCWRTWVPRAHVVLAPWFSRRSGRPDCHRWRSCGRTHRVQQSGADPASCAARPSPALRLRLLCFCPAATAHIWFCKTSSCAGRIRGVRGPRRHMLPLLISCANMSAYS